MRLPDLHAAKAAKIVDLVSWAYARKCWWADQVELSQQCWVICLEVWSQYQHPSAEEYGTTCYSACMRQLGRWLRRSKLCVSAQDKKVVEASNSTRRVDLDAMPERSTGRSPEHHMQLEEIRYRLRARLFALVGFSQVAEASARVFLDGWQPQEVATDLGLSVRDVYRSNESMRAALSDAQVIALAGELAEVRGAGAGEHLTRARSTHALAEGTL